MIIDVNAFAGHWPAHQVEGELPAVRAALCALGVERLCVSPLDAAWGRNPHGFNGELYGAAAAFADVWPVPVLDPTVATWREELSRACQEPKVRLVRLLPAYSPYPLDAADELLAALADAHLGVIVQTRLEDPRRQHPLAQVPDVPAVAIVEAARRHPNLTVIIGGARTAELKSLREAIRELPRLYADVSQADGFDAVRFLVEAGLSEKLMFGSHSPLFIPHAGIARITTDLSDDAAAAILGGNALRAIDWRAATG